MTMVLVELKAFVEQAEAGLNALRLATKNFTTLEGLEYFALNYLESNIGDIVEFVGNAIENPNAIPKKTRKQRQPRAKKLSSEAPASEAPKKGKGKGKGGKEAPAPVDEPQREAAPSVSAEAVVSDEAASQSELFSD